MSNDNFNLKSKFEPAGDQPKAIDSLVSGLKQNLRYQTLLGVTGFGKTFTMVNVIAKYGSRLLSSPTIRRLPLNWRRSTENFFPTTPSIISFLTTTIISRKPIFRLRTHI